MRIREIVIKSLKLPIKRYKLFFAVFVLFIFLKIINESLLLIHLGDITWIMLILNILISLIVFGMILSFGNAAVVQKSPELNFRQHLIEAIKEYLITMYYIVISFVLSSIFSINLGVFNQLVEIQHYAAEMDINHSILTLNEMVYQLPISMQMSLQHSIQLDLLVFLLILIVLSSFGFIGRVVSIKSENWVDAFDLRVIFSIIKQIGFFRYLKFIIIISIVSVILCNVLVILKIFGSIVFISFLESLVLFFIVNSFYLIIEDSYLD